MSVLLGNLSVVQMEERLGITLADSERTLLESMRCEKASVTNPESLHIFDIPFTVVCGSRATAIKVNEILVPYSSDMACQIGISIQEKKA